MVQNFGILYLLMLRKSSHFPVFVKLYIKNSVIDGYNTIISIPNVLQLYFI